MKKSLLLTALLGFAFIVNAQRSYYRYWFDNNTGTMAQGEVAGKKELALDVHSLSCGMHNIHLQIRNASGKWSPVYSRYFFKPEATTARYWFDNDMTTLHENAPTNGPVELDITQLPIGLHAVHYQTLAGQGQPSAVRTRYFFKSEATTARYWFDNETTMQTLSIVNGAVDLDVSHLSFGIHALHFQSLGASGGASPVHTKYFYKKENLDISSLLCRLWIDDNEETAQTFALTDDIVMEVGGLDIGMHELHAVLLNANGMKMAEATTVFEMFDPDGIIPVPAFSGEDEAIYNLAGQRLNKLRIGINIKGGKKVLVK